jgi:hypothetical protein
MLQKYAATNPFHAIFLEVLENYDKDGKSHRGCRASWVAGSLEQRASGSPEETKEI